MFCKAFALAKGDVVSITGAGGKTSLMFALGEELRQNHKVLITTSTKIYIPSIEKYDFIYMLKNKVKDFRYKNDKGIYILGYECSDEGKLIGLSPEEIDKENQHFDFVLVEADGSKRKPLKGWRDHEPVICSSTSKTIGVLDIQTIGLQIYEENVHRIDKFLNITKAKEGHRVQIEHLVSIIFNPEGLFKDAAGEKILFINKVETERDKDNLNFLLEVIRKENKGYLAKAVAGSIIQGKGEGLVL